MIHLARRLAFIFVLLLSMGAAAQQPAAAPETTQPAAQQPAAAESEHSKPLARASEEAAEEKPFVVFGKWTIPGPVVEVLRWSNFLILLGLLFYLLRKPMKEFFASRTKAILEGIENGRKARQDATERLKEIEARLANLESEITALRQSAEAEARADRERLLQSAAAEAEKILVQAEQEIGSLGKAALAELKAHTAALAVQLAEQRIREQMTPEREAGLMRDYAGSLRAGEGKR